MLYIIVVLDSDKPVSPPMFHHTHVAAGNCDKAVSIIIHGNVVFDAHQKAMYFQHYTAHWMSL